MLTIKIITAGSILISQSPAVTIGPKGSDVYQSVVGMTAACQTGEPLDVMQVIPDTFIGEGGIHTEDMVLNSLRPGVQGEPIAVLITDIAASDQTATGTSYQFIYAGDEAHVLNENGITIHHIK